MNFERTCSVVMWPRDGRAMTHKSSQSSHSDADADDDADADAGSADAVHDANTDDTEY